MRGLVIVLQHQIEFHMLWPGLNKESIGTMMEALCFPGLDRQLRRGRARYPRDSISDIPALTIKYQNPGQDQKVGLQFFWHITGTNL